MAPQSLTVCENDVEQDWRKLTLVIVTIKDESVT